MQMEEEEYGYEEEEEEVKKKDTDREGCGEERRRSGEGEGEEEEEKEERRRREWKGFKNVRRKKQGKSKDGRQLNRERIECKIWEEQSHNLGMMVEGWGCGKGRTKDKGYCGLGPK